MNPWVIGIGSPVGDDQAGWLVVRGLRRKHPRIRSLECRSPAELLGHLPLHQPLLLVDAMRSGRAPGTVVCLRWPAEVRIMATWQPFSSHGLGLLDALTLADKLGLLAEQPIHIWGIEIDKTVYEEGLCPGVAAAVDRATRLIANQLLSMAPSSST